MECSLCSMGGRSSDTANKCGLQLPTSAVTPNMDGGGHNEWRFVISPPPISTRKYHQRNRMNVMGRNLRVWFVDMPSIWEWIFGFYLPPLLRMGLGSFNNPRECFEASNHTRNSMGWWSAHRDRVPMWNGFASNGWPKWCATARSHVVVG